MALEWHGLKEERFRPYRTWINDRKPGICGTYCCAVLTHDRVFQDTGVKLDKGRLIDGLYELVDAHRPYKGTFIWDIRRGLNKMFEHQPYQVNTGLVVELNVPDLMDQGFGPFIIGLIGPLGSKYGNHWVLAYQYAYDQEENLFFKCYDNHGQYKVAVAGIETLTYAYLKPVPVKTEEGESHGKI